MCLAALLWSRCRTIYYGNTAQDAAAAGFDDSAMYEEIRRPNEDRRIPLHQLLHDEALTSFATWRNSAQRIDY